MDSHPPLRDLRRALFPIVLKAGAGPHQLPEGELISRG